MSTAPCVYGFARSITAFIFFTMARRRIPLLVQLTAMNWIKREFPPAAMHSSLLPSPAAHVRSSVLQQEPPSPKRDPKRLYRWQTSNKLKMGEGIKLTGWSWTGNHERRLSSSHCCRFPGGNHRSLSWTTTAREQHTAIALHCIVTGLTGLSLTGLSMLFPTQTPLKSLTLSQSSTADKTGNPKSLCPPPLP